MSEASRIGVGEATGGLPAEAVPLYDGLSHLDVIGRFAGSRGEEPGIGGELSRRLVEHAGLDVDPSTTPLIYDGAQVAADDGRLLTLADYVDWAGGRLSSDHKHSDPAMLGVIRFLTLEPGTPKYESTKLGIMAMIQQSAQAG